MKHGDDGGGQCKTNNNGLGGIGSDTAQILFVRYLTRYHPTHYAAKIVNNTVFCAGRRISSKVFKGYIKYSLSSFLQSCNRKRS